MPSQQSIGVKSYIKPLIWGMLSGTVCIVLLFIVAALIIANLQVPIPSIPLIVSIVGGIGGFVGGYVSARIFRKKGLIIGLFCGLIFALIILLSTMCFSGHVFSVQTLTKLLIIIVAAMLGGMLGVNAKRRRR